MDSYHDIGWIRDHCKEITWMDKGYRGYSSWTLHVKVKSAPESIKGHFIEYLIKYLTPKDRPSAIDNISETIYLHLVRGCTHADMEAAIALVRLES